MLGALTCSSNSSPVPGPGKNPVPLAGRAVDSLGSLAGIPAAVASVDTGKADGLAGKAAGRNVHMVDDPDRLVVHTSAESRTVGPAGPWV